MRVARSALSLFFSAAVALGLTAGHTPSGADELSTASGPELFRAPRGALGSRSLPPGFTDTIAFSGLSLPTVVQFAADGRVFIGEKSGLIEVFDSLSDTQPTVFADLRTNVYDYGDRGLLGMALDPHFPAKPFVYVLYTLDAPIKQQPPVYHDACTQQQGACVAGARLSKLEEISHDTAGPEQVLMENWCQQFPSHSIGTLAFGPDGRLYVGGGDGASFNAADYGQFNHNPCKDPGGKNPTPPTAEGGALRAQDLRTPDDKTTMDGAILRVKAKNGKAPPDNPLYGGTNSSDDRIIAEGLRNPFRFTFRPGTDQIYIGDVGWNTWEEIDILGSAQDAVVENFGWACYEGDVHQSSYDNLNLNICEDLYGDPGAVTLPLFSYGHNGQNLPPGNCPANGGTVISAISFYAGGSYPPDYNGALFFGDHGRRCLWVMFPDQNGIPDPSTITTFEEGAGYPVDLKIGPGGDLFYVDIDQGQIRRISHTG